MNFYTKMFPHGLCQYNDKELWEMYDKIGVEIHNRGIEKSIYDEAESNLNGCECLEDFIEQSRYKKTLSKLEKEDLVDIYREYWEGRHEEEIENEIDDFLVKECDYVK